MRKTFEPLGTLETAVMAVVWKRSPITAREVCERMTGAKERAYTTIMTTMERLHRKGLLDRRKDGIAWRYRATMTRAEFEKAEADGLARGILRAHGDVGLAAFVDAAARVDEALLDRLAKLVAERRKAGR